MSTEIEQVTRWLDEVVIGLNLCPFAKQPRRNEQVRFVSSTADQPEALLEDVYDELSLIEQTETIETTLLIVPKLLSDFDEYNQFLDLVDQLLIKFDWDGTFQVASFHPDYCFADTAPDSMENLTNRSPFPILHIIREASIEKAVENITAPDEVYKNNIQTVSNLSQEQIKKLFYYL